ncbi:molybdate-anion transporter [Skeletonema marinoi]|uniref:Molybdate-anion transporter n=1 Tax=Skeletonema marinoi TaxID=267567 RepID=A0AAD8Y7S9_9STRA|nr:molybdate-anion transporter [Skeletonema marinoi]
MAIGRLKRRISAGQDSQLHCDDTIEKSCSTQIPEHRESESSHEDGIVIESRLYPQHRQQDNTDDGGSQLNQSPRRNRLLNVGGRSRRLCSAENIAYLIFFILLIFYVALQIIMATIHLDSGPMKRSIDILNGKNTSPHSVDYGAVNTGIWWSKVSKQFTRFASFIADLIPSTTSDPSQESEHGYILIFQILLAINIAALIPAIYRNVLRQWNQSRGESSNEAKQRLVHNNLLYKIYLPAYLLATCADWLQGPYKYALYSSYGYTQRDIAHLFVAGYGSGMVLGSIVGGLADQYGRKKLCLCYCLCYMFSVSMKHCKNFYMLLLGRVGGGIATSLLFSVFESWLIGAHIEKGLTSSSSNKTCSKDEEEKWLAKSFSYSTYGSSLVAIASGVLANVVVENSGKMRPLPILDGNIIYVGGYIAAFDSCLVPLLLCAVIIVCQWDENYGGGVASNTHRDEEIAEHVELVSVQRRDSGFAKKHSSVCLSDDENVEVEEKSSESLQPSSAKVGLLSGIRTVWSSQPILSICVIASAFEGSMYIFIFLWTPALTHIENQLKPTAKELPFGWIFASFMLCCLLGTMSFSRLSRAGVSASKCLVGVLALAAASCLAMAYPHASESGGASSVQYWGMLSYEFAIGAYYPSISVLKGTVVPEDQRAAIYNVFRLPLNLLVLINLTSGLSTQLSFLANAILLIVACILQIRLVRRTATLK